jgi:hypothetical protein
MYCHSFDDALLVLNALLASHLASEFLILSRPINSPFISEDTIQTQPQDAALPWTAMLHCVIWLSLSLGHSFNVEESILHSNIH